MGTKKRNPLSKLLTRGIPYTPELPVPVRVNGEVDGTAGKLRQ
jgi:hypothetical protein